MKTLDCTTLCLPFLCHKLGYTPTALAQCIVCVDDGRPIAGVVYDNFNGTSVAAHIWVESGKRPSKEWFGAIFDYPFRRMGVRKIVGQVNSANHKAISLDEHFGFSEEARILDFFDSSDLIFYTMTADSCRVLNTPRWGAVMDIISRVA